MPKLKPLFLGLMLLLTSCSDASTDQTDVSASSPSHAPSREWNVEDWTPKASITPIEMTDEQKEAWRKGRIENDIPADADRSLYKDPGLVKYYDSYQEAGDAIVQCLKQKGFDARSDATGGIIPESVTSSQNLALDVALFECFAMHMPAPEISQDWTEEQLGMHTTIGTSTLSHASLTTVTALIVLTSRPANRSYRRSLNQESDRIGIHPNYCR